MHRHAVSTKHHMYEATADQRCQMFRSARMNNHRPSYDHYLAFTFTNPFEFPRDFPDHQLDFSLAADPGPHESEFRSRRSADSAFLARFTLPHGLNSIDADDHQIVAPKISHQTDGCRGLG